MNDDEMTQQFRDQLKQALEQQAEIRDRQLEINARLDVLIRALAEILATGDAVIEDVPEVGIQ